MKGECEVCKKTVRYLHEYNNGYYTTKLCSKCYGDVLDFVYDDDEEEEPTQDIHQKANSQEEFEYMLDNGW